MFGRIKSVRPYDGYGFIASADGVDRFFHKSALKDTSLILSDVLTGLAVEFDPVVHHQKGPRAINIVFVTSPLSSASGNGHGHLAGDLAGDILHG